MILVACAAATGCARYRGRAKAASTGDLPPSAAEESPLFDDRIDPAAVGVADVTTQQDDEAALRGRARQANLVARMRVQAVSLESLNQQACYRLQFSVIGEPIVQRAFRERTFEVLLDPNAPAYNTVRWLDTAMVGKTFVGFVRQVTGDGPPILRFHFSRDDAGVLRTVEEAKTIGELMGR